MKKTRETIAKIEDSLATAIPEAALKRDLNKMVLALTDSVTNLVAVAKDMADALEKFDAAVKPVAADGLHVKNDDAPVKAEKQILLEVPQAPKKKAAAKKKPAAEPEAE